MVFVAETFFAKGIKGFKREKLTASPFLFFQRDDS